MSTEFKAGDRIRATNSGVTTQPLMVTVKVKRTSVIVLVAK